MGCPSFSLCVQSVEDMSDQFKVIIADSSTLVKLSNTDKLKLLLLLPENVSVFFADYAVHGATMMGRLTAPSWEIRGLIAERADKIQIIETDVWKMVKRHGEIFAAYSQSVALRRMYELEGLDPPTDLVLSNDDFIDNLLRKLIVEKSERTTKVVMSDQNSIFEEIDHPVGNIHLISLNTFLEWSSMLTI